MIYRERERERERDYTTRLGPPRPPAGDRPAPEARPTGDRPRRPPRPGAEASGFYVLLR